MIVCFIILPLSLVFYIQTSLLFTKNYYKDAMEKDQKEKERKN
jgi:hypothetical protein